MNDRKIFIGSGKKKEFSKGGSIINASICLDDLLKDMDEFATVSKNGKRYLRVKIGSRREADQFGNTHSLEIDTWKPEQQQAGGNFQTNPNATSQAAPAQTPQNYDPNDPNDPNYIPF